MLIKIIKFFSLYNGSTDLGKSNELPKSKLVLKMAETKAIPVKNYPAKKPSIKFHNK